MAKRLKASGFSVKGSTRTSRRVRELLAENIQAFEIDLNSENPKLIQFLDSDRLIINIPSKSLINFQSLILAIERSSIRKVLFVSSTAVYKNLNKIIYEDEGLETDAHSLRQIEKIFLANDNFQTSIVRFGGLVGYARHPGFFFKSDTCIKNPNARVNLIHRDDCINIIVKILELDLWGEEFNCCTDTHPTKGDFYTQASKQVGNKVSVDAEQDKGNYKIISNQKIKQMLKYKFQYPDLLDIKFEAEI